MFTKTTASIAALMVAATPALAATATATTDLNLRAGPGPDFEIVGVIAGSDQAEVEGCLDEANWCKVSYNGQEGWAYGEYLSGNVETAVAITEVPTVRYVHTETVETPNENEGIAAATGGVTGGAVLGALIGGPAAVAAGAIIGSVVGADAVEPKTETVTYITEHPVEPVYLEGEVVVGAALPPTVEVYEVPETQYSYINVNGQTVLVEPENRSIVYIQR